MQAPIRTFVPLLALLPLQVQGPQSTPEGSEEPAQAAPWIPFDGVRAVVDDQVITLRQLYRVVERQRQNVSVTVPEERAQLQSMVFMSLLRERLYVQGGADMGLAEEEVEKRVESWLDFERERRGILGFSDFLHERGLDKSSARADVRSALYDMSWRQAQTGEGQGALGRPFRDRFVRPGELHLAYGEARKALGEPDKVEFLDLLVEARATGGVENARAFCMELRGKVISGEAEFRDVVEAYSAVTAPHPPVVAESLLDEQVREFAMTAEEGALSQVFPVEHNGQIAAYRVLQCFRRIPGVAPPPFVDAKVQEDLRSQVQEIRQGLDLLRAENELRRNAYVWVKEGLARQEEDAAEAPAPGAAKPPAPGS